MFKRKSGSEMIVSKKGKSNSNYRNQRRYYQRYRNYPELKFLDTTINQASIGTGGVIFPSMNIIPQGDTQSNRLGRKVVVTKINARFAVLNVTAVAGVSGSSIRVILYVDKQCNGAAATVAQILATADWRSLLNLDNSMRFQILKDQIYTLNITAPSGTAGTAWITERQDVVWNVKCRVPIMFDNSTITGAITSITSSNIGVLAVCSDAEGDISGFVRIRYDDS